MTAAVSNWAWRIRHLRLREVVLLLEAQAALVVCQVMRWRRPLGQLVAASQGGGEAGVALARDTRESCAAVAWAVTRAARYGPLHAQCLVRSLAIQRMLRRRGIEASSLNIGVRMEKGSFEAHAWVDLCGAIVGDSPEHVRTFTKVADFRLVDL